jgi:hypothetical protein
MKDTMMKVNHATHHATLKIHGVKERFQLVGSHVEILTKTVELLRTHSKKSTAAGVRPFQLIVDESKERCESFYKSEEQKRIEEMTREIENSQFDAPAISLLEGAKLAYAGRGANWNYEPYGLSLEEVRAAGLPDYCAAGHQAEAQPFREEQSTGAMR